LKGTYYPLGKLTEAQRNQLIADHFLFKEGDRFLLHCGLNRDWPKSRGIFHNDAKTFLVWVNEEDQVKSPKKKIKYIINLKIERKKKKNFFN
jgi:creatine kinase